MYMRLCLQENTQTAGDVTLHVFDPVTVQISIDASNIQHQKLCLKLVQPRVRPVLYSQIFSGDLFACVYHDYIITLVVVA